MSHDLEIVTKECPEHRRITEFIESRPGLALEGKLGPQEGNVTVRRKFKGVLESIIQVWGPDEAEPEDLADAITQAVKPPYWLVRITVPTAVKETVQLGEALAIHIAKGHGGVVYDPQAGSVIWPKMQVRPVSRSSDHERIRVVTLAWYLPSSQASTSMAQTFLQTTRRLCPEAVPVRFGLYHPLQGKLKTGEEQPFLDAVEQVLQKGRADMFELKAKAPSFSGMLWIPDRNDDPEKSYSSNYVKLDLDFDGRVVESDSGWCDRIVSLFLDLAMEPQSILCEQLRRTGNFRVSRRSWIRRNKRALSGPCGTLERNTLGAVLVELVRQSLPSSRKDALKAVGGLNFEDGVLVRLGTKPADFDQLRSSRLGLPPELVSDMRLVEEEIKFSTGRIVRNDKWEAKSAQVIPNLR